MKEIITIPPEAQLRSSVSHRELFHDAGEEYLSPPIESIDADNITPDNAFDTVAQLYFEKMSSPHRDRISNLVEEVRANDVGELLENPDAIVCVPAAAHNESLETLTTMFDTLSQQDNSDNIEVLLFGNYPDSVGDEETVKAHENISKAVAYARENYPGMVIRHATVAFDETSMGIGTVRKDMMDLVAADAADRNLKYTQPILWVDSDLTRMSKSAVLDISTATSEEAEAFMYHLNPRQTIANVGAATLSLSGLAEKVAVHYEISRRQKTRSSLAQDPTFNGYIEESGLGFMLGNYLLIGGVNAGDAANESTWLQAGFNSHWRQAAEIMIAATGKDGTEKHAVRSDTKYLPGARIYTSGRRLVSSASDLIGRLNNGSGFSSFDIGDNYGQFSHTEKLRDTQRALNTQTILDNEVGVLGNAATLSAYAIGADYRASERTFRKLKNSGDRPR